MNKTEQIQVHYVENSVDIQIYTLFIINSNRMKVAAFTNIECLSALGIQQDLASRNNIKQKTNNFFVN